MPVTLTQFDKIEIEWLDASLAYAGEFEADRAGELSVMTRMGYFIGRRKHSSGMSYLVIASERCGGEIVREPMSIPEQWVLRIRKLEDGKAYGKAKRRKR